MNKLITAVAVSLIALSIGCQEQWADVVHPWFIDLDGDGFGDENDFNPVQSPTDPSDATKYSLHNTDCDDADANSFPGNPEVNDGQDNNCDGFVDNGYSGQIFTVGNAGPAGGIVFYVTPFTDSYGIERNGLEAAPADIDVAGDYMHEWGCYGIDIASPGASPTAIGTGAQNTADMLNQDPACITYHGHHLAAELVDAYSLNGFNDWFLPSKDELNALKVAKDVVGGFPSLSYWSSSEIDSLYAGYQGFGIGLQNNSRKYGALRVRAVRAF